MALGRPIQLTGNVASKTIRVLATDNQTVFTVIGGYRINQLGVFRNGVRLSSSTDFQALDGVTVTLVSAASENDEVLFQVQDDFRVSDAIVSAASSQTIYGDLSINGNLYYQGSASGILTTGGDASQLTNVVNSITPSNNVSVSSTTGHITIGLTDDLNITGNLSIGGTLTYEDVSNVDSVGLITARSGINVGPTAGIGITLNPDGSIIAEGTITAAGSITAAGTVMYSNGTDTSSQLTSFGVLAQRDTADSGKTVWRGFGGNTQTSAIFSDGSITAASSAQIGGDANNGTAEGCLVNNGFIQVSRSGSNSALWAGYVQGSSVQTSRIDNDGSITAAGDIQSGGDPNNGGSTGIKLYGGQGTVAASGNVSAQNVFLGYTTGSSAITSSIKADGSATFAGTITDSIGPLRRLGQNIKTGNYTLVASDAGKHIRVDGAHTITVPDSVFLSGDMITIVANSSSDVPITQGSGLNLYNASDGTTGSKTQAARTVSTILFAEGGTSGKAYISGGGLS